MSQTLKNWLRDLKNSLFLRYSLFTKGINYPVSILPKRNFKYPLNFDYLSDNFTLYIVRRANVKREDLLTSIGTLKDGIIPAQDVPYMSMNLLGGNFNIDHLCYRAIGKGSDYWTGGSSEYIYKYISDFQLVKDFSPLTYAVKELHNIPIPYYRPDNPDAKKFFEANKITAALIGKNYLFNGFIEIQHKPINLNYWHVELALHLTKNIEVLRNEDRKWVKNARKYVIEQLLSFPFLDLPNDSRSIKPGYYDH